ncbi:MAG: ABC transporter ATP-binding protein, partial [Planctomycetota bacterium]
PTLGTLRVAGHDCDDEREEVCQRIGFMPETFHVYEDLRVYEYLQFFAGAYGIAAAERPKQIEAVIELTDLGPRRDSLTRTLSKGMRQRLLLAKTLIHDPEVLLLDEPTSGMDPQARIEFRNIVRTLRKMQKTVVISSHILSDLSIICSSFGIMERGRLGITGTLEEVSRAMKLKSEVRVDYLEGPVDALAILRKYPLALDPHLANQKLRFFFDGTEEQKAEILKALVQGGVRVTRFEQKKHDLEDIFLQFGATRVQ